MVAFVQQGAFLVRPNESSGTCARVRTHTRCTERLTAVRGTHLAAQKATTASPTACCFSAAPPLARPESTRRRAVLDSLGGNLGGKNACYIETPGAVRI